MDVERAVAPCGLQPHDVHDAFNLFMNTGVCPDDGGYCPAPGDALPGDCPARHAEIDLGAGLSSCPAGDGISSLADGIRVHPVGYQIFATGCDGRRFSQLREAALLQQEDPMTRRR